MHVDLTATGRRTGKARTLPLYAFDAGDGALVIIGSRGGSAKDPEWANNLRADPKATVKVGTEERSVVAREVSGQERDRLWAIAAEGFPLYETYQRKTKRQIPLFLLEPA
ncbi:MAG: nitroreductase family deazaflavin-dependent oxidoreductase [Chloroflexota bacterium]|nr:nitroreductase family deazaflavin-dependent oxidoreductase [Chloroflexota bacterium]